MNYLSNLRRIVAVAGVLILAGSGALFAQAQTGNIYGVVSDNQGSRCRASP
jgi:hypothetical protein